MINRRSFLGSAALALLASGCQSFHGIGLCHAGGKVPFKFGMAGFSFFRCTLDETLAYMKALDVHYLCIKDFHLPFKASAADIATFHRKCADHGVTGYGVGPIYMLSDDEAKRAFEYAARVGVKTVVCVPAELRGKTRVASRARCETLARLCAEYDMRAAIHNHGPDIPECFPTGDSAYEMVKDLDPRVGLCLDIGHNYRSGKDPAACIRKYADRLFDFHLKDIEPHTTDIKADAKILGRGVLDLPGILKALVDVGYAGSCSIEYETNFKDNLADLAECAGYFKALCRASRACG